MMNILKTSSVLSLSLLMVVACSSPETKNSETQSSLPIYETTESPSQKKATSKPSYSHKNYAHKSDDVQVAQEAKEVAKKVKSFFKKAADKVEDAVDTVAESTGNMRDDMSADMADMMNFDDSSVEELKAQHETKKAGGLFSGMFFLWLLIIIALIVGAYFLWIKVIQPRM